MASIAPPAPAPATPDPWIDARRALLKKQGYDLGGLDQGRLGLAFSGGGIRSATIALGIAQALAKDQRLLDFDTMSTVSGGGYFGSFLRSLFLPQTARGSDAVLDPDTATAEVTRWALDVLESEPDSRTLPGSVAGTTLTNPVRWLRENSRYLAPAGPTDYAVAATYIIRNWVAMLFVFALPTLLFFLTMHGTLHLAEHFGLSGRQGAWRVPHSRFYISNIIALPGVLLIFSIFFGVANWLTVFDGGAWLLARLSRTKATPARKITISAVLALITGACLLIFGIATAHGTAARLVAALAVVLGGGAIGAALATILTTGQVAKIDDALFGNELRRKLTAANSSINAWLIALLALAIVDTIALALIGKFGTGGVKALAALTGLAPLGRLAIQKLQSSFAKMSPGGAFGAFVQRYIWQVAFVAAVLLWGAFAVLLDLATRAIAYPLQGPWWPSWLAALVILVFTSVITGASTGFINLSSLHSLYAARLTRAYLGATNEDRLANRTMGITGYQTRDVIRADIYQQQLCAAPLHLINVTLNETISATGSQLLERDRKGVPMVIGPEGIWIDAAQAAPGATARTEPVCSWTGFAATDAEHFSVGELTAISGAAFSSAMGARTTLGGSLLFTYANIRLGYWWPRGTIGSNPADPADRLKATGTFGYLAREMLGRYRSTTARVNLSDGGHFDNTGLYELLRRKTPVIVFSDNGEDPGYHFEDLEILVRKARLDIGRSVEVATPAEVLLTLGLGTARLFLNGRAGDWRARAQARDRDDPAFALLLLVRDAACKQVGTIVLLKPSLFGTLPADVWGYAEQHPDFPQESTSDQFFTEAQWESYRKLGFGMMQQLLSASPYKADLFRRL